MHQVLSILVIMTLFFSFPTKSLAGDLTIRLPSYSDGRHEYYHDLIVSALKQAGHEVTIENVSNLPHLREWDMLENGTISVLWLIRTKERDKKFLPIPVPLTNGLIGQRILLVPPGDRDKYKDVKTLEDFRRLGMVGGFGTGWYDVEVWNANSLPYLELADWRLLYKMTAKGNRNVNYLPRGFNEVAQEALNHPELVIEPHLMLVYNCDFILYVSPMKPRLAPILWDSLTRARDSGLMGRLVKKYWTRNYDIINPERRTILKLRQPE